MTRDEHLAWAKQRAHEYVEMGDNQNAIASMLSDLGKHPELARKVEIGLIAAMHLTTKEQVKHWIEGF